MIRKLPLRRETVRTLANDILRRVQAGYVCTETMGVCDSLAFTCFNTCTA